MLDGEDVATKEGAVVGAVLQRGLRTSNLEFVEGEVLALQDAPAAASGSCTRGCWALEVWRWRWA
ncbi:hypothetical protein BJV78DRAFT_1204463 [Lactifluus subvellereus]|nr:hypothetical protein BJV78DRAFT_1204463 [Lactifluus subvellereus]